MNLLFGGRSIVSDVRAILGPDGHVYVYMKPPGGKSTDSDGARIYRHRMDTGTLEELPALPASKHGGTLIFLPDGRLRVYASFYAASDGGNYAAGWHDYPGIVRPFTAAPGIISTPPPPPLAPIAPTPAVDQAARTQAEDAVRQARAALAKAEDALARAKKVESTKGSGLNQPQIEAIAWQKGRDALQALINEATSSETALRVFVRDLARHEAWTLLQEQREP